ncbi:cell division protein ZipA [Granulosicoccus sp. 3-233]|uniref:cell division protein ZipA n=1 Tax=Granulosicoccus sp. 3-233 TaxID=3417969 RepID=UPI003D333C37
MENLRWILIAAGVAILVLLYFSGKPRRGSDDAGRRSRHDADSEMDMGAHGGLGGRGVADHDPLLGEAGLDDPYQVFNDTGDDDFARPAAHQPSGDLGRGPAPDYEFDDLDGMGGNGPGAGFSSFSQKLEAFSEMLSPKRRKMVAQSEPADLDEQTADDPKYAQKIVTLHVVAAPDTVLSGEDLLSVFERRGYHFGDMNIFHSMHEGSTVFSVAKMIEPGYFDINDLESFQTPGITLILQLPGPVPADVAFAVLVSEAYEIAEELNATVLDEQHSTLTKQTVQHLKEGIYEYMHRQKYFGTVSS